MNNSNSSSKNTSDVLKNSLQLNSDFLKNIDLYIVIDANNYDENINYPIIDDKLKERYIAPIHNTLIKNGLNINYQLTEEKILLYLGLPKSIVNY